MSSEARVFIVDDHPIVRQGLTRMIEQEPDLSICGEAEDAPGALKAIVQLQPDIVILDLSLQRGDGLDLTKSVHEQLPSARILILTMHNELFMVERAFQAGASGYLPKHEASTEVLVAIRKVLAGEVYVSEDLSPKLMRKLLTGTPEGEDGLIEKLSDRELQVFQRIGSGLGTRDIAMAMHLSVKTVETYREHIKEKLGLNDSRQLLQYAIRWHLLHTNQ